MNNFLKIKKKILYRAEYRGTKEMDLIVSSFVKKYINVFSLKELKQLEELLNYDDDILFKWYFNIHKNYSIPKNKVFRLFKNYRKK